MNKLGLKLISLAVDSIGHKLAQGIVHIWVIDHVLECPQTLVTGRSCIEAV